jgi:hypothetical protein
MQTEVRVKSKKETMPVLVGVDIGFGELKRVSSEFPTPTSIPSAVVSGAKPTSSKLFELHNIEDDCLIVTTEEGTFFVGNQAMHIPTNGSKRTQVRDRANDLVSRVLFQTGIALSVPHENGEFNVFVVTGLPNDDYDLSIKTNLEEFLNKSFEITFHLSETRTIKKKINVIGSEILRQPEGSVTYNQFEFDIDRFLVPSPNARTMVGIIDFGHFTTDYALFQEGVIIENDTVNGSTVGVTEVYNKLRRRLIVKFDAMGYEYRATDKDLDMAVRTGIVQYMGQSYDVAEEVKASAKEVASVIAKAVLDSWGNETNRLELIIISGGGSHIFSEFLNEEFKARRKQGFQTIASPQFSNVLGFFMYGCISMADQYSTQQIFSHYINPVFVSAV